MNKHILIVLISLLSLAVSASFAEELVHVLQKGETLYAVSRKYHVTPESIMSWNKIDNPDKLKAGQKLKIPEVYVVQKGDTLYGIARKMNIPVETLLSANGLKNDSKLNTGDTLYLPSTGTALVSAKSTPSSNPVAPASPKETEPAPALPSVNPSSPVPVKPLTDPRSFDRKKVDTSIIWPVSVQDISYLSGKVYGVSITSGIGEKVKVISSGTVLSTGPYRGFGQVVFLQSKTGYIYVYGGLGTIDSKPGQNLAFGDEIGTLGADSLSGTPRLYFMVYNKDMPVDPAKAPRGY